jgi:hypothetical protein
MWRIWRMYFLPYAGATHLDLVCMLGMGEIHPPHPPHPPRRHASLAEREEGVAEALDVCYSRGMELKMTRTCETVIRRYAGEPTAGDEMRSDVFLKAVNRCKRAGWLQDTQEWPYTGITEAGLIAIGGIR